MSASPFFPSCLYTQNMKLYTIQHCKLFYYNKNITFLHIKYYTFQVRISWLIVIFQPFFDKHWCDVYLKRNTQLKCTLFLYIEMFQLVFQFLSASTPQKCTNISGRSIFAAHQIYNRKSINSLNSIINKKFRMAKNVWKWITWTFLQRHKNNWQGHTLWLEPKWAQATIRWRDMNVLCAASETEALYNNQC